MYFNGKQIFRKISRNLWQTSFRKQANIFLLFIGIALFIWLMIKLSNEYDSSVNYNIRFINSPGSNSIISNSDSTVILELTAKGFRLFSIKYLQNKPLINIDLNDIKLHKSRYTFSSYILTKPLHKEISRQLKFDEILTAIKPDTLFLNLEPISRKRIPVIADIGYDFEQQYQLYGQVNISPDSIILSGPPSYIDTINSIKTKPVQLQELKSNRSLTLNLLKPFNSKKVLVSSDTVNIFIPVEKFTEASMELPIRVLNNNGLRTRLFPDKINLTYLVALKDYNKVNKEMFNVAVLLNQEGSANRILNVEIRHHPNFIKIKHFDPRQIEYIILK